METEQKLKPIPCPFCGATMKRAGWHLTLWTGHAENCWLEGSPLFDNTVERWNNRPAPVSTDGLVKRLRGWALDEESSASNLEGDFEPTDMNAELYKSVVKERREKAKQMFADANLLAALTPGKES